MPNSIEVVNDLLVHVFNNILTIEKEALEKGALKELTVTEIHVIEAVGLEKKTMSEVASLLKVKISTLTASVNKIVRKGYIERLYSNTDRRVVYIKLTHKGILAYRIHESFHGTMVKVMMKKLDAKEHEILIESLRRLTNFFEEEYKIAK